MTLIKNVLKIFAVTVLLSANTVLASDFLVDTTINDAVNDANGGSAYEIKSMDISSVNDVITVDIYTNFVGYNNTTNGGGGENIVFGDLLIGIEGTGNAFDYAFVLSDGRDSSYASNRRWSTKHWDNTGTLTELNNDNDAATLSSKDYHGINSPTGTGEVMASETLGTGTAGTWSVDHYGKRTGLTDKISFSFNVGGISAFQSASQLAFSWAMSCANDVVEGVANVTNPTPTSVPAPATFIMLLAALGYMANSRRAKK